MPVTLVEGFKYTDAMGVGTGVYSVGSPVWARVAGRGSRYAIEVTGTTDGSPNWGQLSFPLQQNASYGFAAYHHAATQSDQDAVSLSFMTNSKDPITSVHSWGAFVSISADAPVGAESDVYANMATWTFPNPSATTEGWHWWNVVASALNTGSGYIRVYRDGVLTAQIEGDVAPLGDFTSGLNIRMGSASSGHAWGYLTVGDLVVRDDTVLIPDTRVDVIELGSTSQGQWTGSDGNSVDNHLLLAGTGPTVDGATYVEADGTGLTDVYGLETLPAGMGSAVDAVQVTVVGGTTDSTLGVTPQVNSDPGAAVYPTAGAAISQLWESNPTGDVAWTKTDLQAATIGLAT